MAKNIHEYDDIINLPHHQSPTRPHMPNHDRAAQFSPFAALTGHEDAVRETARLTEGKIQLDEDAKIALDEKLRFLLESGGRQQASITYFEPDNKKAGGAYLSVTGIIKNINGLKRTVTMEDGTEIPIDDILDIREGFSAAGRLTEGDFL